MSGGARCTEQCRLSRSDQRQRTGRLRAQREAAVAGRCASYGGSHAARCRVRLSAQGDDRAGGRRLLAVESADLRRGSLVDEVEEGTDANALPEFSTVIFHCGGAGARPTKDGLSATAFPSGVRTIPVEATESVAPVVFYRREFREGSGGAGKLRGGLGQVIELGGAGAAPIALLCNFERVQNPARGRDGGRPGAAGTVALRSGRPIRPKGRQTVPPRDAIRLELPGGGGVGDPGMGEPRRGLGG